MADKSKTKSNGGSGGGKRRLRSRQWFDNPDNPGMTALYIERYLNFGLTPGELRSGKPIIGIAQTGSDLSPCNRHHLELAKRVRDGITAAGGLAFEFPVHPIQETGKRPTAALDRNLAYLGLVEMLYGYPHRRRGADHRLRQDDAGLHHGGGDGQHSRDRALRRADAQRLASRAAHRLRHDRLAGARRTLPPARSTMSSSWRSSTSSAPSIGHCNTMGTASTMNSLAEALGMSLPGCAAIPAPYRERGQIAYETGRRIVEMVLGGPEALRHPDARGVRERDRRQFAPSAARPTRRSTSTPSPAISACQLDDRRLGDDRPRGAAARQHAAGRQISRRGISPRRRRCRRSSTN